MARKPKTAEPEARSIRTVRMTDDEWALVARNAEREGLDVSTYLRIRATLPHEHPRDVQIGILAKHVADELESLFFPEVGADLINTLKRLCELRGRIHMIVPE